jgi:ParB/RepB/Spo0J family partition protein
MQQIITDNERIVEPERLHPNPDNPRIEAGDVTELAQSIRELGQLQALLVRPSIDYGEGHYVIEAGERRWVAMRTLGMPIRCDIRMPVAGEDLVTRNIVVGLVENGNRESLTPIERALALGRLRDEKGMSQADIAAATGWHPSTVNRLMLLLDLAPGTRDAVAEGKLGVEDALRLVRSHRRKQRKDQGKKPDTGGQATWEPDWLTNRHALARKAKALCDAREHGSRRRIGGLACGQCWETAIRADEAVVQQVRFQQRQQEQQQQQGHVVPVMPPWHADQGKPNGVPS